MYLFSIVYVCKINRVYSCAFVRIRVYSCVVSIILHISAAFVCIRVYSCVFMCIRVYLFRRVYFGITKLYKMAVFEHQKYTLKSESQTLIFIGAKYTLLEVY